MEAAIEWTWARDEEWTLSIRDNGIGMSDGPAPAGKYGLSMMRKRSAELDAELEIRSADGGGMEIVLRGRKGDRTE